MIFNDDLNFEERADYIESQDLKDWTVEHEEFSRLKEKLIQTGAKLLVGPRGTGKTHLMLSTHYECLQNSDFPLSTYISFNHYLRLESYLHSTTNTISLFHTWVLTKIYLSAALQHEQQYSKLPPEINQDFIQEFLLNVESQKYEKFEDKYKIIINFFSVHIVKEFLHEILDSKNRKRFILLLDDAALTLTKDFMIEFFDIFRSLKSPRISPKASIYPGTTQFGPRFHVGQDAEKVNVWHDVQQPEYLLFLSELKNKRLQGLEIDENINKLLMYSSFGIPRAYLNLLRAYTSSTKKTPQSKFNNIIQDYCSYLIDEYLSISDKLHQYKSFIDTGRTFFDAIVKELTQRNHNMLRGQSTENKHIHLGVNSIDLEKNSYKLMINFLQEAGLLYEVNEQSHGQDRRIKIYVIHYAFLLKNKAFTITRGFKPEEILHIISLSIAQPYRKSIDSILHSLGLEEPALILDSCSKCHTIKISPNQKFCHNCGSPLVIESTYKKCMNYPLNKVPLTKFQKSALEATQFKKVQDVVMCTNFGEQIMQFPRIGTVRSNDINQKVVTWVEEFLY